MTIAVDWALNNNYLTIYLPSTAIYRPQRFTFYLPRRFTRSDIAIYLYHPRHPDMRVLVVSEAIAIKFDTVTASDTRMHHV